MPGTMIIAEFGTFLLKSYVFKHLSKIIGKIFINY